MYDPSKGVIAIATGYSGGKYTYSKINHDLLQPDTMKSTPDQMQDLDTYINGKGYLKRTVMEHSRSKWECNTCTLTEKQWISICDLLDKGFRVRDGKASVKKRHLKARFITIGHMNMPQCIAMCLILIFNTNWSLTAN